MCAVGVGDGVRGGGGGLASVAELVPVPLDDAQSRQVRKAQTGKKTQTRQWAMTGTRLQWRPLEAKRSYQDQGQGGGPTTQVHFWAGLPHRAIGRQIGYSALIAGKVPGISANFLISSHKAPPQCHLFFNLFIFFKMHLICCFDYF